MAFTIRDKPDKEREFSTLFGFNDRITFRSAELDEDVASADSLGGLPIHNINFYEGGVRVPFPKLLVDFLHYTNLTPTQLKPNTFKIVMGVDCLNQKLKTELATNINELSRSVNHADINEVLGHKLDGFGRACHILLSYTPRYCSISSGSIPKGYPSLPTLRGKKSKVTSQQIPQVQELLEKAQSSSSSESLFGDREEIANQEIPLPVPEPKKRERSAFREALRQAKKVDTIVQGLRKGSHIQARGSSNVLAVAEATIENVKLPEVTPVASAEASRAAEVKDSSLRRQAKKKKKSTYIDKTLDQPTYEGSSRDKGKKALLESLPHFSTVTSDQVSVKIKPEYTFKGIGPLLRFRADMLSLSKMASTDLSYEAFTHMMIVNTN
ncbi:hypothetical protein L1049_009433 [Liquidambar formosana]|uniref:Uncharacterized protein n=1 Tax=Liquidambar formosana TaxID=63359 RepID=A0AAP0SB91_LIQFO